MVQLGFHVSTAGKLSNAFLEAAEKNCDVFQIFVSSPQQWKTQEHSTAAIEDFVQARKSSKVKGVLVHAAYLPNIASPKDSLRNLSKMKMKEEMMSAFALGADGYNFHPGSNPDIKEGIKNVIDNLNRLAELSEEKCPIKIIIENDAGAGSRVGDTVEELATIWKGLKSKKRFGFTLDTCHLFVSGIDIRTKSDTDKLLKDFDDRIGLEHLEWIHLNDSQGDLGSKKDRHANIGEGFIGEEAFRIWLNHPKLKSKNFVMETPRREVEDMKHVRGLIK